jgi:hypothetical protein
MMATKTYSLTYDDAVKAIIYYIRAHTGDCTLRESSAQFGCVVQNYSKFFTIEEEDTK